MKKFLLICVAVLFCATSVSKAQDNYKVFNFGVKLGANMTSLTGLKDISASLDAGFTGGAYFELRPVKQAGISIEALYSGHSDEGEWSKGDMNYTFSTKAGYLDFPILAKWYIWNGFSINAGIMPSFLVNSSIQLGKVDPDKGEFLDLNKSGLAIPLGIGYSFSWGLMLDARYNIGVTKLGKDEIIGASRYGTFTFMAGWRF